VSASDEQLALSKFVSKTPIESQKAIVLLRLRQRLIINELNASVSERRYDIL